MYYSRVLEEQVAGAGRRRVIIEKPQDQHVFLVKAIFRCPNEARAREFFNYLLALREPKATTPAAPATQKKRGRRKRTEENNNE